MTEDIDPSVPAVNVQQAENVNAAPDFSAHPAVIYLVAIVTIGVLIGFACVTFLVLNKEIDVSPETRGSIIQTWNNLAVGAAAVWTTSSIVNRLKGTR